MSTRARLSAAVSTLTTRQWGAGIRIVPIVENQYSGPIDDPDRATRETRAIVSRQNVKTDIEGARRGTRMQGVVQSASRTTRAFIRHADYAALGYIVRKGDRVVLLDEGDEVMRVGLVEATDVGGMTIELHPVDEPVPGEETPP